MQFISVKNSNYSDMKIVSCNTVHYITLMNTMPSKSDNHQPQGLVSVAMCVVVSGAVSVAVTVAVSVAVSVKVSRRAISECCCECCNDHCVVVSFVVSCGS